MVSSIGSYNNCMSYLQASQNRPNPAEMFNQIDSDESGGISQSELETFTQAISDMTGNSIDSSDAVSTYDADGDGELSANELKSFMDASGIAPPPPGGAGMMGQMDSSEDSSTTSADSVLSQYDTNGDGVLSSDELQAYLDENNASFNDALMQQALSAYGTNFGGGSSSSLEDSFINSGEGYIPVDLSV